MASASRCTRRCNSSSPRMAETTNQRNSAVGRIGTSAAATLTQLGAWKSLSKTRRAPRNVMAQRAATALPAYIERRSVEDAVAVDMKWTPQEYRVMVRVQVKYT